LFSLVDQLIFGERNRMITPPEAPFAAEIIVPRPALEIR
jgi:hypothetical protein